MKNIKEAFLKKYKLLDRRLHTIKDRDYEYLVNFSQTKNIPMHRWFYYQEGYSPDLVKNIFKETKLKSNARVLDPFCGSGTTLVVAKELGYDSAGVEINPFSAFVSEVKTRSYKKSEIKQLIEFAKKDFLLSLPNKIQPTDTEFSLIDRLFSQERLNKLLQIKQQIVKLRNNKVKNACFFAWLSILEKVSNYRRGGNGLKRRKRISKIDPFVEFKNKLAEIANDLLNISSINHEPRVINDSSTNIKQYDVGRFDIAIFSPPYANCFDPFEVYKIELWMGEFVRTYEELRKKRKTALSSNLNAYIEKTFKLDNMPNILVDIIEYLKQNELWDKRIPYMLNSYFIQMREVLQTVFECLQKNGYCAIVVGNSAYSTLPVPTDIILGLIGEDIGFSCEKIIVARTNETSSQQHLKLGNLREYLRESIVLLKK